MSLELRTRAAAALAPPRYLALPAAGVDVSTSGVKAVRLEEGPHGLTLAAFSQTWLPSGAFADGDITDRAKVAEAIASAAAGVGVGAANVALPEPKCYLFDSVVQGGSVNALRTGVEQHLDELIPLPPAETVFDLVPLGPARSGGILVAGVGFARRVVDETLAAFDEAGIATLALESETFAMARALLPAGDESTVLIIDVGKTTTKIGFVERAVPRFSTTIAIGGHALTLAVQKHFGVTELEARRVKASRGIVPAPGNEDYLAAMLSTVSAIRDEISRRLDYWQEHAREGSGRPPVSRAILVGGNASVKGLPEYLESALKIPVASGDVFTNFASRDWWLPPLDYSESLAYATAIGLALRDRPTL